MTVAAILLAYAVLLCALAAPLLRRARWVERAPRLAIGTWQALTASVLAAVFLAGLAVAIPAMPLSLNLAELLRTCVMTMQAAYRTPGGAVLATGGLAISTVVVLFTAYGVGIEWLAAVRQRRRHAAVLDMVARRHDGVDALVLPHDVAAAYCLPGRTRRVVVTTAALATMNHAQLAAVLAHEHADVSQRHHLLIAAARGIERVFAFIPAFCQARAEIERLTELAADDAAAKHTDRLTVADALLRLAEDRLSPAMALAASRGDAATRVRRLITGRQPPSRLHVMTGGLLAVTALITPFLVLATPLLALAGVADCCAFPDGALSSSWSLSIPTVR